MVEVGLSIANFNHSYEELLRLNLFHMSSKDALKEFTEINCAPRRCLEVALETVYERPVFEEPIAPVENAVEVLHDLAKSYTLVLVSKGNQEIQKYKMMSAGISESLFKRLHFCKEGEKKMIYQIVSDEMAIPPQEAFVCGDRISYDLTPAKRLGYTTIQMKWGRGLGNTGFKKDVDYTILNLKELKPLLETFKIAS